MCEGKSIVRELLPTQFLRMMRLHFKDELQQPEQLLLCDCCSRVRACHESVRRPVIALQCPVFGAWLGGS